MKNASTSTVTFVLVLSLFATSSARRGPKLLQSLEKKQGYMGWGLPSLDMSTDLAPEGNDLLHEDSTIAMKQSKAVKEVLRTPTKLGSKTTQKQELPKKTRRGFLFLSKDGSEPLDMVLDGLE